MNHSHIEIYQLPSGELQISVQFDRDTVWLSLSQLSQLFGRDKSVISRHLKKIFESGELSYDITVAKKATVQKEGSKIVQRLIEYYNLDAIISVGYHVNSIQGTQFRIWATNKLKEYLTLGYTINEKRITELNKIGHIIQETTHQDSQLNISLALIKTCTRSFSLLNQYDKKEFDLENIYKDYRQEIKLEEAMHAIESLRSILIKKGEASDLFDRQKDNGLESSLNTINQTFDGNYLYPTIEEQAANLLYLKKTSIF